MNNYPLGYRPAVQKNSINRIVILGFLLRLAILILILSLKSKVSPYFLGDDWKYETTAYQYLFFNEKAIDLELIKSLTKGYARPFWPYVMCISAGLFNSMFVGRFLNILMSAVCIRIVYNIVGLLTGKEKPALLAAKLFAFLPVTVLTCCFPIKDIFLTMTVMYAFYIFLLVYYKQKLPAWKVLLCIAGLVGTYFTRGAVVELMAAFFVVHLLDSYIKRKKYARVAAIVLVALVVFLVFRKTIIQAFVTKIQDYSGYNQNSTGLLSNLQMKNWWEVYKIPGAYLFATLQPMTLDLLNLDFSNLWNRLVYFTNIAIYPVAIANAIYIFQKKHNLVFWLTGVIIYCAIVSMCLGIFRHYLFLLPLEIINCALYFDRTEGKRRQELTFGSIGLLLAVLAYSLL